MQLTFKLFLFVVLLLSGIASQAQDLILKDGVRLGDRQDFIEGCVGAINKDSLEFEGMVVSSDGLCSCMADELMPTLTSEEVDEALRNDGFSDLMLKGENYQIVLNCLRGHVKIDGDKDFNLKNLLSSRKEVAIKACVDEVLKDGHDNHLWTTETANQYCTCAMEKLYESGFDLADLGDIEDENSEIFNEIVLSCVNDIFNQTDPPAVVDGYNADDVIGPPTGEIALTNYLNQGFKIKISIGGVTKYFLLDTGASDLVIDQDTERELLLQGFLNRNNYEGKEDYKMANGQVEKGQNLRVDGITLGNYTLNNVPIVVLPNGSLLCGRSLLDKFSNWRIDQAKKLLILEK